MEKLLLIKISIIICLLIISIMLFILKDPGSFLNSSSRKKKTTSQTNPLDDINVKDESVNYGTSPSSSTPSSTQSSSSSSTSTSSTPSSNLQKTVNCNKQDELHDFCSKPNTFIKECQLETYTDNDTYSKKLLQCVITKYNVIDEQEYNDARNFLISNNPKYGDHKSEWYIPPYIKNIDCQNQTRQNLFCQEPNKYIDACISTRDGSFSDAYDGYARKLQDCITNNFMLVGYDEESKNNYKEARQKLIDEDSKYGDPLSQFYIPPYIKGIDCGKQDELFCQNPEGYVDVCLPITFLERESYYSNKMRECITTEYPTSANQEIKDNLRDSYNKAKDKLKKLYPNIKISDFPTVSCELENQLFCDFPDEYIKGCFDTKIPRNATEQQIKNNARNYSEKVNNCLLNTRTIVNKEKFKNAKKLLLEKDSTLIISDPPTKPCQDEDVPNMFCQFPDEYIEGCKILNNTSDELYIQKLKDCLKNNKAFLSNDSYKRAISLIQPNNLPSELSTVDCKLENQQSYFCGDMENYIKGCKTVNNNNDSDYINKIYNCLLTEKSRVKSTDYSNAVNLLDETIVKQFNLPSSLPTVDCFKPDENDMICRKPDEYTTQCKNNNIDYPSKLSFCLENKKILMDKTKYENAVKELNYPSSLPREFPTVECKDKNQLNMFCSKPDEYIKSCPNFNSPNPEQMLNSCLINAYDKLEVNSYKEAIRLLNNPTNLPSELPTVDCSKKEDLDMFCSTPDDYIKQCKPFDKYYFEGLIKTCLFDKKYKLNSTSYKNAISLLDNPSTLPTDVPTVDCKEQTNQNEFCKKPEEFIDGCKNLTNQNNDWYISNVNNCLLFNIDKMNNDSYKKTINLLNNPISLPSELPTVNCSDLSLFCNSPDEYIKSCSNIIEPDKKLKYCLRDERDKMNNDSYKNAINLLNNPSSLPSELPSINCINKQDENMFCSKPDEYIKYCMPFGSPNEIQMLNNCLNGDSYDKLSFDSYKEAIKELNYPTSLPTELPSVKCKDKNDINSFCLKPDKYIESCSNFNSPNPEQMLNRCLNENISSLNKDNYNKSISLLNYPSTLPRELPTVKCSDKDDQNMFCSKSDEYIKFCSPILFPNSEERLKDCLLNKKDLLTFSSYKESIALLNNPKTLPSELPTVDCKLENQQSYFCGDMENYIKGCKQLNNNNDYSYSNKINYCLISEKSRMNSDDYSNAINLLDQTIVKQFNLPSSLPTVDCFKPDENDMLCKKPDEYVNQCKNNNIDYSSKLSFCLENKKILMDKTKYENAVKTLNYPSSLPKEFPTVECKDKNQLNMFCKTPEKYIKSCPNFNSPNPEQMLNSCINTNINDLQNNIEGYKESLTLLGNTSLPTTLPSGNCIDKNNKNIFCKNPDKYIDCPSFTNPNPTELLQSCLVTNLNDIKNNIDSYNNAKLKLGNPSSLPTTIPSVDCNQKQTLNMFCKNPDQYIDCPNFTAPNPTSMLGNCLQFNMSDLQTNVSGYKEALKKLGNPTYFPEILPEGDCNFKTNLNYFCKMPDKLIGCPNFDSLNTLQKCFDSNINELNSNVQGYNNARKMLGNPSFLPITLPGNNCNLKNELNAFCYSPDKYINCPNFTNPTPKELLSTCVTSRLSTLRSNSQSYNNARQMLGNPSSLPKYLPQGNCLYSGQPYYFCREPNKYIGCPYIDPNKSINDCNDIYPEFVRDYQNNYNIARDMLNNISLDNISTPSQYLRFKDYNSLMRNMQIKI